MTEKAGVAHPYWIICELCELCEQMPSVYFFRKVSMFFRKSCEQETVRSISRQEALSRPSPMKQLSEAAKAANRTEIVSPANEQYENRSKLLRYHYKQEPMRKQRSGIQAEYKRNISGSIEYSESSEAAKRNTSGSSWFCCLSGAPAPAYCLLAADIICRNLKDLLPRLLS